jgi:hypothetical protein
MLSNNESRAITDDRHVAMMEQEKDMHEKDGKLPATEK